MEVYVSGCCGILVVPGSAHYDTVEECVGDADAVRDGKCPACDQRNPRLNLVGVIAGGN